MSRWRYWLSLPARRWHRRGFGVQSPWAFELVTSVLFCSDRYYAFDELGGTAADEQLFRVVRWVHPRAVMLEGVSETERAYVRAAQADVEMLAWDEAQIANDVFVVVDDIRGANSVVWKAVLAHVRTTSAFDMGRRGIAFFDPCRQRQTYLL